MRNVLKAVNMDLVCAGSTGLYGVIFGGLFITLWSFMFSPLISDFIILLTIFMVVPLHVTDSKSDCRKLYGVLPADRSDFVKARFIYIFAVHFVSEIISLISAALSMKLKLYRIFPSGSSMIALSEKSFSDMRTVLIAGLVISAVFCIFFAYMEMMGQIFGRDKVFKIVVISLMVLIAAAIIFFKFVYKRIDLSKIRYPDSLSGRTMLHLAVNVVMFVVCYGFGMITSSKVSGREL